MTGIPGGAPGVSGAVRRAGPIVLPFAVYLVMACIVTFPLAVEGDDHVWGLGTPPLNVWAIGWVHHQLPRAPLQLFDANIFHPYPNTLAFSEHLFVPALLGAPARVLTDNLVLVHNLVALLTYALAGLGMYLLAFHLTSHRGAALAAGAFYAFHTWNVNELIRLQILSNQWFPLVVLSILLFFERPTRQRAGAAAAAYLLQSLSCMYWALYLPLLVAPLVALLQWRTRLAWRRLGRLGIALGLALAATGVFFLPYQATATTLGFERALPESIDLRHTFAVMPGNWLYGSVLPTAGPNADGPHFLGLVSLALAAIGLVRGRFREGALVGRGTLLVCAVVGLVLSLGPEVRVGTHVLAPAPYRALYEWLPGFRGVRYPERFTIFVVLGLAPLVAAGVAALVPRRRLWAGLTCLPIVVEHLAIPLSLSPLPPASRIPQAYRWLAQADDVRVMAWLPVGWYRGERHDAERMYYSTAHWKRTVQGFSGYFPPTHNLVRWRLRDFPSRESVAFLEGFGVDAVVVEPLRAEACQSEQGLRVQGPFADGSCVVRLRSNGRLLRPAPREDEPLIVLDRAAWHIVASHPGAEAMIDGNLETAWTAQPYQTRGDIVRVGLAAPTEVARVEMRIPPPFELPMHLRVLGYRRDGTKVRLDFDERAAYDRFARALIHRPGDATLAIDLPDVRLKAIAIRIQKTDGYRLPWTMSEIRVLTRAKESPAAVGTTQNAPTVLP